MSVTIIWPSGDTDTAPTFEALEDKLRHLGWNPVDPGEFRDEMAWRARLWKGAKAAADVQTTGSSEEFLNSLAAAGCCKLRVTQ